jgi:hypothetical protein
MQDAVAVVIVVMRRYSFPLKAMGSDQLNCVVCGVPGNTDGTIAAHAANVLIVLSGRKKIYLLFVDAGLVSL